MTMSSGASSGGNSPSPQPSGFRSASSRLTIWLRPLLVERLTEYGSVTRFVSTAPVLGAKTVTS